MPVPYAASRYDAVQETPLPACKEIEVRSWPGLMPGSARLAMHGCGKGTKFATVNGHCTIGKRMQRVCMIPSWSQAPSPPQAHK